MIHKSDYDGIEELDNPLPRWWVYLFYLTIVFGVVYSVGMMAGWIPTNLKELASDQAKYAPKHNQPNPLNDLKKAVTNPSAIKSGEAIFTAKCAACHGPDGGGIIGPNLTDSSWIHGNGTAADIYKVVHDGVPEKGMLAWGTTLKPNELIAVVAYVQSLAGSSPASPKAPEGTPVTK